MSTAAPETEFPDYDNPPVSFFEKYETRIAPAVVAVMTVLLTVLSFPPLRLPEFAYTLAVPAALWAYRRPDFRLFAVVVLGANAVAWTILLGWLHHVTWAGLLLLGPFIGAWVGAWFLALWWVMPRLVVRVAPVLVFAVFGLAGLWVVNEALRAWVLGGFPWLPLAASQWERGSILQVAAFTGAGGVSFVLIALNLGFAASMHRLFFEPGLKGLQRRSQEFFAAMFLLIVCLTIHVQESFNRAAFTVPVGRFGFVQPDVPQEQKWDPAKGPAILETLASTTLTVASRRPDLILWPEAVTPWAVRGDAEVEAFVEDLARRAQRPILLGSIAIEPAAEVGGEQPWFNGSFLVDPSSGVAEAYYAKRRLVPFGEFVPLRSLLGWIDKMVPLPGDFEAGRSAAPLLVVLAGEVYGVGPLICYEDIFPRLARETVRAGADLLVVQTNNGWFGQGGAAYQHAAHSVLRAVETRRPVLRVGNAGWSGWIDEFGNVRAVVQRVARQGADGRMTYAASTDPTAEGSIYFRGSAVADVTRDARWIGRRSFYVEHGDWLVWVCAGWFALAVVLLRGTPAPVAEVAGAEREDSR